MHCVRRAIVAVALCGLLAGCAGKSAAIKPKPTALERSICSTVAEFVPHFPSGTESGSGPIGISVTFINDEDFAHSLVRSGDPVFRAVGRSLPVQPLRMTTFRRLDSRCKALGL